ncbi:MAG: alpha/beta hydrolase [Sporomusaceae bacterium]|nr:alpha/beta hydrolase [Sporomusaceae bacterium]
MKIAQQARKLFAARQPDSSGSVAVGYTAEKHLPAAAGGTRLFCYCSSEQRQLPLYINMHGGGFIMGSAADDDDWCRRLANATSCLVVNIDYRLAPEYPFPAALEECYAVIRHLHRHAAAFGIDCRRIAVGGQSAGANLAAALCLLARDRREISLLCQVLNYPPLDMALDPAAKVPAADAVLTAKMQRLFNACYLTQPADALNPLVSPLLAADVSGLPPALLIAAELDPLREEAERYASRLAAAGVPAVCDVFAGCMHAFTHFGSRQASERALQRVALYLRETFALAADNG